MTKNKILVAALAAVFVALGALTYFVILNPTSGWNEERTSPSNMIDEQDFAGVLARARSGELAAIIRLIDHYADPAQPTFSEFDLAFGQNEISRAARYWSLEALKRGDRQQAGYFFAAYERSAINDQNSVERRREFALLALEFYFQLDRDGLEGWSDSAQELVIFLRNTE